jgi:hypothetical protein
MGISSQPLPDCSEMSYEARLARYTAISTALSLLSDRWLDRIIDAAPNIGSGIGGRSVLLEIEGTPIFAKIVPLTNLERRPEHFMSTANLFDLPTFFQYGLGSFGFGVWRELAAHIMTTNWVLGKQCERFPLLYHWRVLPASSSTRTLKTDEQAEIEHLIAFWDGSPAVRERIDAITRVSAYVVLFLEYIPQNLQDWLTAQVAIGDEAVEPACSMIERDLRTGVSFMNARGLLHFDAHFRNILTDGRHLYFTDFGLATSPRFVLSEAELAFLDINKTHDACYTVTQLVNWLVMTYNDAGGPHQRNEYVRRYADGDDPDNVPPVVVERIKRYASIAVIMNDFYRKLYLESRTTPYPVDAIQQVYRPDQY